MPSLLACLAIAAIVGAGLITGLLFAFSTCVMRALLQLPPAAGMLAMQRINVLILNPLFLALFLGTAALCAIIAVLAAMALSAPGAAWLLAGAVAYLAGPFGITMARNVPLNNRLAPLGADQAEYWPRYADAWLRWNHLRTALGALAILLLAIGLAQVEF